MLPMNSPRIFLLNAAVVSLLLLLPAPGRAQRHTIETTNRAGIKLSYIKEAKLNEIELQQVLTLAQGVGITNIASVSTVYGIPGMSRHVIIKSGERINGRNISYCGVSISRTGWQARKKTDEDLQPGDFQVEASGKYTTLERTYELAGVTRRVSIAEKDIEVADLAIPLIAARKVRFKNEPPNNDLDFGRFQFERMDPSKPDVLTKGHSTNEYELEFSEGQHIIYFRFEDGKVLITRIGTYHI